MNAPSAVSTGASSEAALTHVNEGPTTTSGNAKLPAPALDEAVGSEDESAHAGIGIVAALGRLGPGAVVSEEALAKMYNRCRATIKRAVIRGELPRPARMMGELVWTAGALVRHLESRLEHEAKEARRLQNLRA